MGTGRVVFISEPGRGPGVRPLAPDSTGGRKLAKLLGCPVADVGPVVPIVDRWQGKTQRGAAWPSGLARTAAENLLVTLPDDARLVLIGDRVAQAFGVGAGYLSWTTMMSRQAHGHRIRRDVAVVPALGGAWWKDPAHVVRGQRFFDGLRRRT